MTHRIQQESIKRRLAKLAAPIFIETLLIMMLGAVDTIMLSRHSDNSVAAVGVVNQIIMLTFLVFEVINLGTSVLCSQYLGARLEKKVVQVVGGVVACQFVGWWNNQPYSVYNGPHHSAMDGLGAGTDGRRYGLHAYRGCIRFFSRLFSHSFRFIAQCQ